MRTTRLSSLGVDTEALLLASEAAEGAAFTDLLYAAARICLSNLDVQSASVSMHGCSDGRDGLTRFGGAVSAGDLHDVTDFPRKTPGRGSAVRSDVPDHHTCDADSEIVVCRTNYDLDRSAYQCRLTNDHVRAFVFQLPYRAESRVGVEISLKFANEDQDDLERLEFLIVPFYLAALRLFRIIDRGTVREWLALVDGLSPVQMTILREVVGTPRYNLASISERLEIGKRGITSQLYRIRKIVEPKLPQPELQDGNGSPLVDLVRIYGFLQFTGRPAPGQGASMRPISERSLAAEGNREEDWKAATQSMMA